MNEPVRASLVVSDPSPEEVFAALLNVERFPEWAFGLKEARTLRAPASGVVAPGTLFEFTLSAASMTHKVTSTVTVVEPPRLLQWRYTKGAAGTGGWTVKALGGAVEIAFFTSYQVSPPWLDRLANRPFFKNVTEDLLRRSMRRFGESLGEGRAPADR